MNDDLISRGALKVAISEATYGFTEIPIRVDKVIALIDNSPSMGATEERSQGAWVKVKEERMSVDMSGEIVTRYKCSKCGRVIATFPSKLAEYYPFCHCGAKMKGGAV